MKYGFVLPGADLDTLLKQAQMLEAAGWDAVFYWDAININNMPMYDPWAVMTAIALRTERVKIGAMLTPLSRRRPWKVARETVSLDHISHGRFILPVGLGALDDGGFTKVNEVTDRKTRAELLDESIDILYGLWSGQPFSYQGKHYQVQEMTFLPKPVQQPHIPIWVVGAWPSERSMARVLRCDGLLPYKLPKPGEHAELKPEDLRAMNKYVQERRTSDTPFDIVMEGETPGNDLNKTREIIQPFIDAGATWWLESRWTTPDVDIVNERIQQGPPRLS